MAVSVKTDDEFKGFMCYWRIDQFAWRHGKDTALLSRMFRIETLNSKWRMEIHKEDDSLAAYLSKRTDDLQCSELEVSLFLFTNSGWITFLDKSKLEYGVVGKTWGSRLLSFENMEKHRKIYLPQGALTLVFHISNDEMSDEASLCLMVSKTYKRYVEHRSVEIFSTLKCNGIFPFPPLLKFRVNQMTDSEIQLPKELKTQTTQTDEMVDFKNTNELLQMFSEKQFSFVTLRTPSSKFVVHKSVLCAKSPVFKAMFEKNMMEKECNSIDIEDIDEETMTSLVRFLHFEPLGDLNHDSAVLLYYAADKYQIDALKKECVSILAKGLCVENICDIFILADFHQDKDLMDCAQEYFGKNSRSIFLSEQWKDLILCHPELIAEILYKSAQVM